MDLLDLSYFEQVPWVHYCYCSLLSVMWWWVVSCSDSEQVRWYTCASVTKQCNLAKGLWCSVAGKVTTGLAESDGSYCRLCDLWSALSLILYRARMVECVPAAFNSAGWHRMWMRHQIVQPVNNYSHPITGIHIFYTEVPVYFCVVLLMLITSCWRLIRAGNFFCDKLFGWEQLFTGCIPRCPVLCQSVEWNAAGTRPSLI